MPTETFAITESVFCRLSVLFCTLRHQTPSWLPSITGVCSDRSCPHLRAARRLGSRWRQDPGTRIILQASDKASYYRICPLFPLFPEQKKNKKTLLSDTLQGKINGGRLRPGQGTAGTQMK